MKYVVRNRVKGVGKQFLKKGKRFPIQKLWEPFPTGTFILIPPEIARKSFCIKILPMDVNFDKKYINMYFSALLPELLSKNPVSYFLRHPAHLPKFLENYSS
jgi:hypothetical protein